MSTASKSSTASASSEAALGVVAAEGGQRASNHLGIGLGAGHALAFQLAGVAVGDGQKRAGFRRA